MTYRTLAASPLVLLALTTLAVVVAPAGARDAVTQGEVDLSKGLACAGMAVAALSFERGDYLRRGWGIWAACYVLLLGRDAATLLGAGWPPEVLDAVRSVLVTGGNAGVVVGAWTLARAWSVAGLEHPGSKGARRAVVAAAVLAAAVFAGPTLVLDLRAVATGGSLRFDSIASDLGDILSVPLVAPVALTALAVRDGTLKWPWMLLTTSLVAWLLYDALYTVPDLLHLEARGLRLASEQLHVFAGACAGAAGLAQRKAVTDDDDELSSPA